MGLDIDVREHRPNLVFVEDFIEIPYPTETVRDRFVDDGRWLEAMANAAERDGEAVRLHVGPSWGGACLTRQVRVRQVGRRQRGEMVVISIAWEPTSSSSLLPVLEGDLELAPIGTDVCRMTLSATYVPPLGEVGSLLDRAFLHHIAQSTLRSFLQRLARSFEQE